ncbi:MAG: UDP-N-acetylmuramoylalanine--D-glutamate ligase [Parcubacteria group bacterium Athens1014_10]|nr:MAG: UDP-N-acetylmuramoylalanine--D-glutamate ligase [Parcubacteria group bacterium Athens1014_10]TSD05906.1 MAG: UDP-N-acetylmuramoylalanine--D-glutamate ligase [Parcubacteria group bacterium Athens0714_12]
MNNKKILIWGLGKSGISLAKLLIRKGFTVYAGDDKKIPLLNKKIKIVLIKEAEKILKGVDIFSPAPGISPKHRLFIKAQKLKKEILGEIEIASWFLKGKIIAVTGTDGKSTTCAFLHKLLKNAGLEVWLGGNYGKPLADFAEKTKKDDFTILEISSFQGFSLKNFRPNYGFFLNLSDDHLDWHLNLNHYLSAKYKIFQNQTRADFLIINDDNSFARAVSSPAKKYFFSLKNKTADAYLDNETIYAFKEKIFSRSEPKLLGEHNLSNLMASCLLAKILKINNETIRKTIKTFSPLPHRLELARKIKGVKFYNDSKATTPQAMRAAIESFPEQKIILIAGGKDKGSDFKKLKEIIKEKIKAAVLIGKTKNKIKKAWQKATLIFLENSMEKAVKKSFALAKKDEIVLLSPGCSSLDMFANYKERGKKFKKIVKQLK